MRFTLDVLPLLLLSGSLTACMAGTTLGGGSKGKQADKDEASKKSETPDDEDLDEPQSVTGAFLCEMMTDPPPDADMVRVGCNGPGIEKAKVTLRFQDGTSESPTMTPTPPGHSMKMMFQLAEARWEVLDTLQVENEEGQSESLTKAAIESLGDRTLDSSVLLAFTTKGRYIPGTSSTNSFFAGKIGADEICAMLAEERGFTQAAGYQWVAVLSEDGQDPQVIYDVNRTVKHLTGKEEVSAHEFLENPSRVFLYDEDGVKIPSDAQVWTGMPGTGPAENCGNWKDTNAVGTVGWPEMGHHDWFFGEETIPCKTGAHLYCIQKP